MTRGHYLSLISSPTSILDLLLPLVASYLDLDMDNK